jgi:toxin ParE1/3/4
MRHYFHPEAAREFEEPGRYCRARGRVWGDRIAAEVRFAIRRILETPERWHVPEEDARRCVARVFPFSVLHTVERGFSLIVAIMHSGRQPGHWRNRPGLREDGKRSGGEPAP